MALKKIGLGGGCHWCTEGVFSSLIGVQTVDQGWIASNAPDDSFSEAVVVHYNPHEIGLSVLIEIHLYTHASTSMHSMRNKYRSAIYVFDQADFLLSEKIIRITSKDFDNPVITRVLPFGSFKPSAEKYQDYFLKQPNAPFCETYIRPKVDVVRTKFSRYLKHSKLGS